MMMPSTMILTLYNSGE